MFQFKQFAVDDARCGMKVGTDGVLLGAWADVAGAGLIVDAGCGSGLVALMCAQRNPSARILAVDVVADACADARANADASPWADRITVSLTDFLSLDRDAIGSPDGPLTIVSNPPFFTEQLRSPEAARSLARHGQGFNHLSLIAHAATLLSHPHSSLSFIAPASCDAEIEFAFELHRLAPARICRVFTRDGKPPTRTLWQVRPRSATPVPPIVETLCIRTADNQFTTEYQSLTSEFYLDK